MKQGRQFNSLITTDTKIIPVLVEQYYCEGMTIDEAFRMAVNQFEGSHAISMHTDLAPGKLFIAQRGSGQTIYFGQDDDGKFIGVNWAESSDISVRMENKEISSITFISEAEATMYPIGELDPESELRFKGFQWRSHLRPLSKEDLFIK